MAPETTRLPGSPLTRRDYENLKASWIPSELAQQALLRRVNSDDGAILTGKKISARYNYAGIVFPYLLPGSNQVREYRLRRDKPEVEQKGDGETKIINKYLSPPGARAMFYFVPGTEAKWLHDVSIPIIWTEGEKKTLALYRLASYDIEKGAKPRFLPIGLAGVWNWRGIIGKTAGEGGERLSVKGAIPDFEKVTLEGRENYILFDANVHTNESVKAARALLAVELRTKRANVRYVNLPLLEGVNGIDDYLANEGPEAALQLIKNAQKVDVKVPSGYKLTETGLYAYDPAQRSDDIWLCAPLRVVASTRNHKGEDWGQLLEFQDIDGVSHSLLIPMSQLVGDGNECLKTLASSGLKISNHRKAKDYFMQYLIMANPDSRARCVARVGWHDNAYILPDETIGDDESERLLFQSATGAKHNIVTRGTLADWRDNVSRLCIGNTVLVFSIACAFAGPLLPLTSEGSGGFHLRGSSATGKTTALLVAGSVWGGGGRNGFVETWLTTANGLEAIAELHNHGLLCLDELGQCDAKEAGAIAYALANGVGKLRMTKTIASRKKLEWELIFLSSGETSLYEHLLSVGKQVRAGQEVRLVDIDVARPSGMGIFNKLPGGFDLPAKLANHLGAMSRRYYGTAIRAYLSKLVRDRDRAKDGAKQMRDGFLSKFVSAGSSGEVYRVASRFALVAAAGEFAREITGWPKGEAIRAAAALFKDWLSKRGTTGSSDIENAIRHIRRFIESHGGSRFQDMDSEYKAEVRVINRAGFRYTDTTNETTYYVLPQAFKNELCNGYDVQSVAKELLARGFLTPGEGKNLAKRVRVPELGNTRVYAISASLLDSE